VQVMDVLLLIPTQAPLEAQRQSQALLQSLGDGFAPSLRTIGRGGTWSTPAAAALALWRRCPFDVIYGWGLSAALAASFAVDRPVFYLPLDGERSSACRWLRATGSSRRLEALCPTATWQRRLLAGGVPPQRCHLIRPGVESSRLGRRGQRPLRQALGLEDQHRVLLAPGPSTRYTDHGQALWVAAILHELDHRYRLLTLGRGPAADSVRRLGESLKHPALLVEAEPMLDRAVEPEELLSAADLLLVTAHDDASTLDIAMGMAAGVPIVATATSSIAELLEDRHTALLSPVGAVRRMAQQVMRLFEDRALSWQLTDRARAEAYEHFSLTRFVEQHRLAIRQAAQGRPVHLEAADLCVQGAQ